MNYYVLAFSLKILRRTYPLSDTQIVFIPQKVKKKIGESDLQEFLPRKCAQPIAWGKTYQNNKQQKLSF